MLFHFWYGGRPEALWPSFRPPEALESGMMGPPEIEGLDGIGGPSGDGGPTGSVALDSRLTAVARRAGTVLEEASSWGVAVFGTGPIARVESGVFSC
jgi:hypothetical protein